MKTLTAPHLVFAQRMRKNLRTAVDGEKIKEQHFVNTLHRKILKGMHKDLHPLLTTTTKLHL